MRAAERPARDVTADTLNPLTAPSDILAGAVPKWQARDDVYQVGQLLGMLVKGDARARIRTGEIRRLPCSDHLKEIVYRCIGERRKRYESADELIEALRNPPAPLKVGAAAHAEGRAPRLHRHPEPAAAARPRARRAGPGRSSTAAPSARTTVVVRGRPNPLQAAGRDAGLKLMEIKRLREKGHRITLLNETQFWRLVARRGEPTALLRAEPWRRRSLGLERRPPHDEEREVVGGPSALDELAHRTENPPDDVVGGVAPCPVEGGR